MLRDMQNKITLESDGLELCLTKFLWYVHEVPTFGVSFNYTNHLHDATMLKCFVHAHFDSEECVNQCIDKLMEN